MAPPPFAIVDSHVHFWDPKRLDYPWLASVPAIAGPHLPKDYWEEAAAVHVRELVFVEADCALALAARETDWVEELAAQDGRIVAAVARVPLDAGAETAQLLKTLAARPLVKGVRHIIQGNPDPAFCLRPAFVEGVRRLADFGLSFDLCVDHSQLAPVLELIDRCPGVRFVLDHVGKPGIRGRLLEPWKSHLRELAARPLVWCKLSGLLTEADAGKWRPDDFTPYLAHAIALFGVDRLLFGSDWPVCRLAGSLRDWVAIVRGALESFSSQEQEKVFAGNARDCYRFGA